MSEIAVILVAAGDGARLAAGIPKALVKVGNLSLLEHALKNILEVKHLSHIVVASHEDRVEEFSALAKAIIGDRVQISFTPGGISRQGSIANALEAVNESTDIVLVHDAARCFTPAAVFDRVAAAVSESGFGVVPVLPVADTIKEVEQDVVLGTIDRTALRVAQTPQGFRFNELSSAYKNATTDFTDDASLMQSTGAVIRSVLGDALAFKITVPADLEYAQLLLQGTVEQRSGIGTDVHRFSTDSTAPLYLGTILWPGEIGLEGHSDGDSIAHAVVDALLSAAGLGDIGSNFGVDRTEYSGANGSVFISGALELLHEAGWDVVNVSVQLIGNKPKMAPRRAEVEIALSQLIGAPVSVGATTTDGLGFLGSSEGIAAVATALIQKHRGGF